MDQRRDIHQERPPLVANANKNRTRKVVWLNVSQTSYLGVAMETKRYYVLHAVDDVLGHFTDQINGPVGDGFEFTCKIFEFTCKNG